MGRSLFETRPGQRSSFRKTRRFPWPRATACGFGSGEANARRLLRRPFLCVLDPQDIVTTVPAPRDPFAAPAVPLEAIGRGLQAGHREKGVGVASAQGGAGGRIAPGRGRPRPVRRAAAAKPATVNPPAIEQDRFGTTIDGTAVDRYTLRNARGMMVRLIKHGATGTELWAPDRPGIEHARLAGGAAQDPGRTGCAVHLPQPRRRPGIPGHARRGRGLHPHPKQRVADRVSSDDRSPHAGEPDAPQLLQPGRCRPQRRARPRAPAGGGRPTCRRGAGHADGRDRARHRHTL